MADLGRRGEGDLIVRRMTRRDTDAVRGLARETWEATYRDWIPEVERRTIVEVAYSRGSLRRRMLRGVSLVAESAGRIVGFADLAPAGEAVELAALYVRPASQNRGIGSRLLREGMEAYPAARCVRLSVLRENAAARRFYEARGFRAVGEHPWRLEGGVVLPELEMVLERGDGHAG